ELVNTPLPRYRNYQSLVNLVPGATPGQYQNSIQAAPARALSTNVNGVNRNNNITRMDGAVSVFIWLPHHSGYVPPVETIDTVNISTNSFDAEQGMAGGAAITVVTKSGTNEIHGSAFAFHDNSVLRARNFFNSGAKPKNIDNIDGVTVGGPIRKNKLFYFGGWEGNRERLGVSSLMTIGTEDQRRGDFSAYRATIYDPTTGNLDGTGRTAFANNLVPVSRQSAIARKVLDLVPLSNRPGVSGNYFNTGTQVLNRDNFDTRINWNRTDTHVIWGKYSAMRANVECQPGLGKGGGPALCQNSNPGVATNLTQVATIGHTWTLTPRLVWDGLLGWSRMGVAITGLYAGQAFGKDVLGIPGTNGPDPRQGGTPQFSISGYSAHLSDTSTRPAYWNDSTFTLGQNFGWMRGAHNLRFGFEAVRHNLNHYQPELGGGPQGTFTFSQGITGLRGGPSLTQYNAYAAFLLGLPEVMGKSIQYEKATAYNYEFGWYLRDRWQVSQRLTLSLGVRYELYPLMTRSGRGGIEIWDPDTNLVLLGGAGGNPKGLGITTSHKLFVPRVGLAYRVNKSTVVRTGYGVTINPMPLARPLRGFYPLTVAYDFNSPNSFQPFRPIEQGIPDFTGPDESTGKAPLPTTALMRYIGGKSLHRGYVQSWNFIIERELPAGFIGSVGYVGTQTVRSFADLNINAAGPGGGTNGRPFFARHGRTVDTNFWNGFLSANYHALQATINRRAAHGLTLKGAYTYSKAINFSDEDGWTGVSFNYLPQFKRNRAQAGYSIPHMLQLASVYELPFGKGKKYASTGAARWVTGGWQVNAHLSAVRGRPFTVTASGAALNAPGNTQTADQVKLDVLKIGGVGPGQSFYDPTAFAPVNDVRFGTSGRNLLRGPGVVNVGLGLFRKFPLGERFSLEFRSEAYNFSNTPHFGNPGSNVNTSSFMQVLSAEEDQRQIRFGLRLAW
ncbi:MAG: TonB-dependent receptor, partial [Acidobacteria bacterium]|nr:TonB-dependent receptor [Acidobacteriota bacterium]